MNHLDALDLLASHPGHPHFVRLCEDDSNPRQRDAFRKKVIAMAGGEVVTATTRPPASEVLSDNTRPTPSEAFKAMNLVRACPHRSRDEGCGCSGARCALGKGKDGLVSHRECLVCVGLEVPA
jgi:hypothetical protein